MVKLQPQPFKLLVLLASRPGEPVTREEIQKELWSDDTFVDFEHGINYCIKEIRTALSDDAENPRFVQTVPRRGYRFIAEVTAEAPEPKADVADAPQVRPAPKKRWLLVFAAALVMVLVTVLAFVWTRRPPAVEAEATPGKPKVTVLYFHNTSDDPELEWLETGLTEMLVTDLSQLPNLEVSSTSRLFQILKEMNQLDERITSLDLIQEVAERAESQMVIRGSFMKAGDNIRINVEVQDAPTGNILTTEKVEGTGESSLFSMVNELTRRMSSDLFTSPTSERTIPSMAELGTQSIKAYRYWIEGGNFSLHGQSNEALAFYEKALEEDPSFADALFGAAIMHNNLGHEKEAARYFDRAFEHTDRTAKPETRYRLEAMKYMRKEETYGAAMEACRKNLELDPDARPPRHWLAVRLAFLERYDEAIEHWEWMRERRHPGAMPYGGLARAYILRGEPDKAVEVWQEYIERFPDRPAGYWGLGWALMDDNDLDGAFDALLKEEALSPGVPSPNRYKIAVLREEWDEATAAAAKGQTSPDPTERRIAWQELAQIALYRGEGDHALGLLRQAENAYEEPTDRSAEVANESAYVLLTRGDFERALEKARTAQRYGHGHHPEWEGIFFESIALANLGQMAQVHQTAERLLERTASIPTEKEKRRHHHLIGEIALIEGDVETAVRELEQARSMLPPGPSEHHIPILYSLASAYIAAGGNDKAAEWFLKIADSGSEHIKHPIPYVRSFYFLGRIHEERGDVNEAGNFYRRFYEYWKDGDMDRERVEEAKRKLSSQKTSRSDDDEL